MPPMSRTCAVMLALALAAGCGNHSKPPATGASGSAAAPDAGPPPGPPGLDRDYARLADRAVKLYEDVAEALRASGEDCAQATARLDELAATNQDVVAANVKILHEGRARELKAALAKNADRLDAAAKGIVDSQAMTMCAHDTAFSKAFDDLVGTPP